MIYRGPCEELWGLETPDPPEHNCLENLEYHDETWEETHGLECGPYERFREIWHECTICHDRFTDRELESALLLEAQEAGRRAARGDAE